MLGLSSGLVTKLRSCCFTPSRPSAQGFGEIAFCAVTAHEQVKGFGTRLMNYTKVRSRRQELRNRQL